MIRLYHAPMEVEGHMLLVDVPWFLTNEEYDRWYKELCAWVREQYGGKE